MDTHFLIEKIQELKERLTLLQDENQGLRNYIHDLEANQTPSGGSRSLPPKIVDSPIFQKLM